MSLVDMSVLGGLAVLIYLATSGCTAPFPAPAVGWRVFAGLVVSYFAMAYMLLGSLFIGIVAQATTVREVQTLSMPVTMGQVMIFFLASYAVNRPDRKSVV